MLRIGPSGNSEGFYNSGHKHTLEAPKWLSDIGLNAFEYSFGRGISISEPTALKIGEEMRKYDIAFSAHAPYYVNFANLEKDNILKSFKFIRQSIEAVKWMSGNRVVFHPATVGKINRSEALELTKHNIIKLLEYLDNENVDGFILCPETMGKHTQIGTVEEIVDLCTIDTRLVPCFDFGHINSYTHGGLKTEDDYKRCLDTALNILGNRAKSLHIHFSKIQFGLNGEIKHLTFEDTVYGPEYEPLAKVIDSYGLTPVIICESKGRMAEDALIMKKCHKMV